MATHQWSPPYFDLILDVLSGCSGGCGGCGVTKTGQALPTGAQYRDMISSLEKLRTQSHFILDHIEVGPTDFMTAANTSEMLDTPLFRELCEPFNIVYFTTTLGSDETGEWARRLRQALPGKRLYFYVVLDPARLDDSSVTKLRGRMSEIEQTLEIAPRFEVVLNSQPHSVRREKNLLNELRQTVEKVQKEFKVKPWHVISSSRKERLGPNSSAVLKDIRWLNDVFNRWIRDEMDWDAHFQYGNEIKPTNKVFVWRNGSWYWPPVLYGHFVSYDEEFRLPDGLDMAAITDFESRNLVEQYRHVGEQQDCPECPHLPQCAQQGIIRLARALGTRECIAPRMAFDNYRQKGAATT